MSFSNLFYDGVFECDSYFWARMKSSDVTFQILFASIFTLFYLFFSILHNEIEKFWLNLTWPLLRLKELDMIGVHYQLL